MISYYPGMLHIIIHFLLPLLIARIFYPTRWKQTWLILSATMLVDVDHLLAQPIYDPLRCSINFHPLHTYWAISVYWLLLYFKKTRLIALGLLIHMALDWQDCHYKLNLF